MILDAMFGWLFGAIEWLFGLLPEWDPVDLSGVATSINGASQVLFGLVNYLDWYLPAKLAMTLLGVMWASQATALIYRSILWVLRVMHITGAE